MVTASFKKYILNFKQPSGTSRGVLNTKETFFISLKEDERKGFGECSVFRGLSVDDRPDYESKLQWLCQNSHLNIDVLMAELIEFPSIQFGLETAFKSLNNINPFEIFPSAFSKGTTSIPINGLIWMGSIDFMKAQIKDKIDAGFKCIKIKIGALDFHSEISLLKSIRKEFSSKDIELRVDANGAFSASEALEKLKVLSEFDLHSIEQPIKQGQIADMARLCEETPLPIALDEELIGHFTVTKKKELLQTIKPQFIILKPSLVGGFQGSDGWIYEAEQRNIGWWITSALESNLGLNAIAQYTFLKKSKMPQGLGTGGLFTNNIESPLFVEVGALKYDQFKQWNFNF